LSAVAKTWLKQTRVCLSQFRTKYLGAYIGLSADDQAYTGRPEF